MSDLVNFKLAQKLKEKGFRKKCLYCYRNRDGKLFANPLYNNDATETYITTNDLLYSHNSKVESRIDAPTIHQVLKWLREEKGIHVCIMLGEFSDWVYEVSRIYGNVFCEAEDGFESYEQAALAGIEYSLDNLI